MSRLSAEKIEGWLNLENETSFIEFKQNFEKNKVGKKYAETIAAICNYRGGYLVFGVADKKSEGKPREVLHVDSLPNDFENTIKDQTGISITVLSGDYDDKDIYAVEIPCRGFRMVYDVNGKYLTRVGSSNRLMSLAEITSIPNEERVDNTGTVAKIIKDEKEEIREVWEAITDIPISDLDSIMLRELNKLHTFPGITPELIKTSINEFWCAYATDDVEWLEQNAPKLGAFAKTRIEAIEKPYIKDRNYIRKAMVNCGWFETKSRCYRDIAKHIERGFHAGIKKDEFLHIVNKINDDQFYYNLNSTF